VEPEKSQLAVRPSFAAPRNGAPCSGSQQLLWFSIRPTWLRGQLVEAALRYTVQNLAVSKLISAFGMHERDE
jgi:hypothetical protein